MYKHKLTPPQSEFIKYRGNTGQIDQKDTIINILAKKPGLYGAQIAELIFDKKIFPISYGKIYKVLKQLCTEGSIIRNGRFYYLMSDAVSHDMAVTKNVVSELNKIGVDLNQARFLSSGIIMAGEAYAAEQRGENFNIDETAAAGVASQSINESEETGEEIISVKIPVNEFDKCAGDIDYYELSYEENYGEGTVLVTGTRDEITTLCDDFDIDSIEEINTESNETEDVPELSDNLEIDNPFASMKDEEREALKDEADKMIAESYAREKANAAATLKQKTEKELKNIQSVNDLIGRTVEINPGKFEGQVIGSVIETRPTGITFLITHSDDPSVEFGTVMPLEYTSGLTYKIVFDFDAIS